MQNPLSPQSSDESNKSDRCPKRPDVIPNFNVEPTKARHKEYSQYRKCLNLILDGHQFQNIETISLNYGALGLSNDDNSRNFTSIVVKSPF